MTCAPVVLLAFNRPHHVQQVLEQIRHARPDRLFIGADGPRDGFADDAQRVREVRSFLDTAVDWDCEVHRVDWEPNRGCEANTELMLDLAFEHVDRAIIFDDDCVPHPSFFEFCTELLDHYSEDERVAHIAGCNDECPEELFEGYSYAFTAFASNWGWATWSRAWRRHRQVFPRPHDTSTIRVPYGGPPQKYMPRAEPRSFDRENNTLVTPGGRRFFHDVGASRDLSLSEWGQQWRLSMIGEGGLAITPAVNLIENVGFSPDSTSNMPTRKMPDARPMTFPLNHPPVQVNAAVERWLERVMVRAVGRLARIIRPRTPERLREPARQLGRLLIR